MDYKLILNPSVEEISKLLEEKTSYSKEGVNELAGFIKGIFESYTNLSNYVSKAMLNYNYASESENFNELQSYLDNRIFTLMEKLVYGGVL